MSVELATAWVSLVPSTKGIAGQVRKEIGGPLEQAAAQAGITGGRGFASNLVTQTVTGLDRIGESIVSKVSTAFKIAAAAGAAALTGAMVGGLRRVLDTEDARIAFEQMGLGIHEIEGVLEGVDRTFDGTPFANPDGFNISAQLLATGRSLEEVEDDLRNIANVTSQTLDKDLNRTSDTFLRIAAQGRVFATDLNFLAQQGIPIRNILADALDVTVEELNSMVSAGEVTFDTMMDAIGATERFEGAAQAMGSSTRGAARNVLTGMARLGESFLGPLFGQDGHAVQALQAIRNSLRELTPAADELGERFAAWLIPAVQDLVTWVQDRLVPAVRDGVEWFDRNRDTIGQVVSAVAPAVGIVAGLATSIHLVSKALALTPIGLVLTLVSALVFAWQNSERFREIVTGAFETIRDIVGPIIERVVGWVRGLAELFAPGGQPSETLTRFMTHAQSIWDSIVTIFRGAFDAIAAIVGPVLEGIQIIWDRWGDEIMAVVGFVFDQIVNIIDTALGVVAGVVDFFVGLITGDWERAWGGIRTIFESIWDGLRGWFESWWDRFGGFVDGSLDDLVAWWRDLPSRILAAVATFAARVFLWARDVIERMQAGFVEAFRSVLEWVRGLPARILAALGNVSKLLEGAGRSMMEGLGRGMRLAASNPIQAALATATSIRERFPGSPAKEGPFSGRGWVLYGGRAIPEALADGILQRARLVEAATRDLAARARAEMDPLLAGDVGALQVRGVAAAGAPAAPAGGIVISGPVSVGSREDLDELRFALRKHYIENR